MKSKSCPRCPNVLAEFETHLRKELFEAVEETQKELLDKGENIIPWAAFNSFRKMILDSFGNKGLKAKLFRIFDYYEDQLRQGMEEKSWPGGNLMGKEDDTMSGP